jgi:hypothetical protein
MRRAVPWRAWSAWLLAVASLLLVFVLFIWHNDALPATNKITWLLGSLPSLAFVTVGAVVMARRPGNRIGWLCYGVGLGQILAGFGSRQQHRPWLPSPAQDRSAGGARARRAVLGALLGPAGPAAVAVPHRPATLAALAPGRLGRLRGAGVGRVLGSLPARPSGPGPATNPIAIPPLEGLLRLAYASAGVVLAGVILAALVSLVVRFRRARAWSASN